jgi:hypothetical protein
MARERRNLRGRHWKEKGSGGAWLILAAGALVLSGCAAAPPAGPDVTASAYPAYAPYPAYYPPYYPYYGSAFFGAGFGFHRHFHRHRFPHHHFPHHGFSHHQFHHGHR